MNGTICRSLRQKRPGLIQIAGVEIDQCGQAVIIVEGHIPVTKGNQPVLSQLPQHPVDVNRAQSGGIGKMICVSGQA